MYGDYQVMKSGGEGLNSDNIFGSVSSYPTATFQNPNVKFTSFDNPNCSYIIPKEENEMMSMIEGWSGYDPVEDNAIELKPLPVKKKRRIYHRHTSHQIQEMEALFKDNLHPDDNQRRRLSKELGLTPLQIKFWFQNRRTLIKAHQDRRENATLKAENDTLKKENHNLHSNLQCLSCSSCRIKLRLENARLRQQLDLLRSTSASLTNPPPAQDIVCFFPETNNNNNDNNMLIAEKERVIVMDLAVSCVQELAKMCGINEPLWNKKRSDNESVCLNEEEYKKMFHHNNNGDRFRREASRAKAIVIMNSITLVNTFLDADKWSETFCSIVSKAKTIQIISSGVSGASGSLLLSYKQYLHWYQQEKLIFFGMWSKEIREGKWTIVDFPIDSFHCSIKPDPATTADQYWRKPSGCIIQDIPNGYSQITWVEHVEVEEKYVHHEAVREYVKSGVAFGAERWLAVLQRQCERMASFMATNITDLGVIPSAEAKRYLMILSQRMVRCFCLNISNLYGHTLSTMKVCGGLVPCAVSITFLPYSHRQVFDLLRDNHIRFQLEILFNGSSFQEVAHIANGSYLGNCISLLRINVARNSSHKVELMLQETSTDNSGSLVVYSTVDGDSVQVAMNGKDLSSIPLLPLGFSVVPVNPFDCVLTVLVSNVATARENISSVSAINSRIYSTINHIASALRSSNSSAAEGSVVLKQEISW